MSMRISTNGHIQYRDNRPEFHNGVTVECGIHRGGKNGDKSCSTTAGNTCHQRRKDEIGNCPEHDCHSKIKNWFHTECSEHDCHSQLSDIGGGKKNCPKHDCHSQLNNWFHTECPKHRCHSQLPQIGGGKKNCPKHPCHSAAGTAYKKCEDIDCAYSAIQALAQERSSGSSNPYDPNSYLPYP